MKSDSNVLVFLCELMGSLAGKTKDITYVADGTLNYKFFYGIRKKNLHLGGLSSKTSTNIMIRECTVTVNSSKPPIHSKD